MATTTTLTATELRIKVAAYLSEYIGAIEADGLALDLGTFAEYLETREMLESEAFGGAR